MRQATSMGQRGKSVNSVCVHRVGAWLIGCEQEDSTDDRTGEEPILLRPGGLR